MYVKNFNYSKMDRQLENLTKTSGQCITVKYNQINNSKLKRAKFNQPNLVGKQYFVVLGALYCTKCCTKIVLSLHLTFLLTNKNCTSTK